MGQLKEYTKKLNKIQMQEFSEAAIKELAARLLEKVAKRTPVGDYSGDRYEETVSRGKNKGKIKTKYRDYKTVNFKTEDGGTKAVKFKLTGKKGGTLRRGWTVGNVQRTSDSYSVDIINPVEYAPYVEYGHRTRGGGFVPGQLMLTKSESEVEADTPRVLENKIKRFLEAALK
jgi:hypothetical protein